MKYDRREIMKNAWQFFRAGFGTFSSCLKEAWKKAKSACIHIKSWFFNKKFSSAERYAINCCDDGPVLMRETAKAVLLMWNTEFGRIQSWIPKSCIE